MSDDTLVEQFQHAGLFVEIHQDDFLLDPRKNYNHESQMVCWHRRADLGDRTINTEDYSSMAELISSFGARVIMPLFLYEHGGMTMTVGDGGQRYPFTDPWDAGQVGFIFMTDDAIREAFLVQDITPDTERRARGLMIAEVAEYDAYLRGECYSYVIRDIFDNVLDSCGGFLGDLDGCRSEANLSAQGLGVDNTVRAMVG